MGRFGRLEIGERRRTTAGVGRAADAQTVGRHCSRGRVPDMSEASAGGGGRPVVFWGRMLLLTPVSYGLVFGANLLFATALLIVYLEPLKLRSTWPFILLTLALGVGSLVGGLYLAKGMWQYYREYIRSQSGKRAARTARAFVVCTTTLLAVLSLAIVWRAHSA